VASERRPTGSTATGSRLTAAQARQLGAALIAATDQIDSLT
jgi:hypothetical protein